MFVRTISNLVLYLFALKGMLCHPGDCCRAVDGSLGTCISITKCPSIQNILSISPIPLPSDVADTLRNITCGFILDMPKVCCTNKPETTSNISLLSRDSSDAEDVSNHRNLNLLPLTNCGEIKEKKITKGMKADLSQYPWMVLLQYATANGDRSNNSCGGSLISDRYVLTAAHCVTQISNGDKLVSVRLGEHDTRTDIDCEVLGDKENCAPPVQDISVDEAIFHPQYDHAKFSYDIAVIRLARAVNISSESVQTICLPTTFAAQTITLKKVSIVGWGTTESLRTSPVLLHTLLPIVSNDDCEKRLVSLKIGPGQMCAGGEGADSCSGDSGGPLMYPANVRGVRMVQFGIVSFGVRGCTDSSTYPGVYSRVGFYMNWILDQMKP